MLPTMCSCIWYTVLFLCKSQFVGIDTYKSLTYTQNSYMVGRFCKNCNEYLYFLWFVCAHQVSNLILIHKIICILWEVLNNDRPGLHQVVSWILYLHCILIALCIIHLHLATNFLCCSSFPAVLCKQQLPHVHIF